MLSKQTPLPLNYDLPVDVQLHIEPCVQGYRLLFKADWSDWYYFLIDLKPADVTAINTKLQNAVEEVASDFQCDSTAPDEERSDALQVLARKGQWAFNTIFPDGELRETVRRLLATCNTLQITSQDFFLPWDLLYDGPLSGPDYFPHFWGMRCVISRNLLRAGSSDAFAPSIITATPRVGVIACDTLPYVMQREIPMFSTYKEWKLIDLEILPDLNEVQHDQSLRNFGCFLKNNFQVLHFACHASERELMQCLLVSRDFSVLMEDFAIYEFEMDQHPLVILNACLTGTADPHTSSNWATLFWRRGARGVLATEFHVPDQFAAAFVERVYDYLLAGEPIGKALQAARVWFAQTYHNPLGLAYALYSRLSVRIRS